MKAAKRKMSRLTSLVGLLPTFGFFSTLLIIGLFNFRKYGISWEAPALRLNGGNSVIYIADLLRLDIVPDQYRQFAPIGSNGMADHGVAYDMILIVLEGILRFSDPMQIYQMRTFVNFLVFMIGTISIYFIVNRRLSSRNLALLASAIFVLSPRIFAAGFYSPSDLVFTCFFALGVNLSLRYLNHPTNRNAIWAGLACGFATDIRLLGTIIFPLIAALHLLQNTVHLKTSLKRLQSLGLYLASGAVSIYLFFPYLWANPFVRFLEVFNSLSRYPWNGKNLYFGNLIPATDLPWHYIPVWILITTPIFYLLLFLVGTFMIIFKFAKVKSLTFQVVQDLLFLSLVILPILVVIVLNSVLYDTWRHLFFVYPFIVVIATIGWSSISRGGFWRFKTLTIKNAATLAVFAFTASWMVSNNPNQNLYFNSLAGQSNLQEKWEMDYLGLSNKEGLNYLFSVDDSPVISVAVVSFTPFDMSLKTLPAEFAERIAVVTLKQNPQYIVNNYRLRNERFIPPNGYTLAKLFTIDDSKYLEIWKRAT